LAVGIADFLSVIVDLAKKDREERLKNLPKVKAKMDPEDLEYMYEDLEKVDQITKCK
jgi:hypothetical protein